MLEPFGPLSTRVYWIRRAAVVGVAVAVVLLLLWIVTGRNSGSAPTSAAGSSPTTPSLTGELTPSSSANLTDSLFPEAASVLSAASEASASSAAAATAADSAGAASPGADPSLGGGATVTEVPTTLPATTADAVPAPDPAAQAAAAQAAASAAAVADAAAQAQAAAAKAAADQQAAEAAAKAAAEQQAAEAAKAAEAARPRDAEGRLICPDPSVKLTATVGAPQYNVGQQPIVGVTVQNVGGEACVQDLSGARQEFIAYDAAGNRVWSTSDCLPGTGTDIRYLQPGQSLQYNIKWSGRSSQPGCVGERTRVPAGAYQIEVRIGTLVSSRQALTFR